jgi:thioredoxin reductase (NADPH)
MSLRWMSTALSICEWTVGDLSEMASAGADPRPAIVVVDDDEASRERLERCVSGRYGRSYRVLAEPSASAAFEVLQALRTAGTPVALIIADQWMPEETGAAFLARTRDLHPASQRLLVATWADFSAREAVVRASVLSETDHFASHPLNDSDEQFHTAVTEVLARWSRENGRWGAALRVIGDPWDEYTHGLQDSFRRFGLPFAFHDADSVEGEALLHQAGVDGPLPVVILASGRALSRPSPADVAGALGATTTPVHQVFDVVVLGAGPAGLAAAVYAASEGLEVIVVEPLNLGGQASSSPMLRNYLGFPAGVGGADLAARAYQQAWTFGADFLVGRAATGIRAEGGEAIVALDDGSEIRAGAVVVATGVSYRRVGIETLEVFAGRGVFYGSGATEARAMAGESVFVVGGANSAGEAAIYLARYAAQVTVLVRGSSMRDGMSDYLVRELEAIPNIDIRPNTEIAEAHGHSRLEGVSLRNNATGTTEDLPAAAVFILIGAVPRTDWLPPEIERDERGFVLTGADRPFAPDGDSWSLATTMPGVFAAGDVRHDSLKRVAAAVGEGSTVIRQIHEYRATRARQLAERPA